MLQNSDKTTILMLHIHLQQKFPTTSTKNTNYFRDHVEKKDILIFFTPTAYQIADVLTKALPKARFVELRAELGLMNNPEVRVEYSNLKEYQSEGEQSEIGRASCRERVYVLV